MVKISLNPETNLQDTPEDNRFAKGITIDLNAPSYSDPTVQHHPYDSMNFTNIYRDDISKYTKYGVPTSRYFNWNEVRAQNQGRGEKWVRGIKKMGVTSGGAVLENTIGVAAGIYEKMFGSGHYYDNYVGKSVDKVNEWMRDNYPNYYTEREKEMNTWQKLGTANFWADTVFNGVGYSLGSIATMLLTGGTGVIGKGAKMMGTYNTAKAISSGKKLADITSKGAGITGSGFVNGMNVLETGLYMSLAESSVEARETQKQVYEDIIQSLIEDSNNNINHVRDLSMSELRDIEETSYAAANSHFLRQLPILAGSNLLMFGRNVAGFGPLSKVNKDVAYDAATKKVVNQLADRGVFRNTLGRLSPGLKGAGTEMIQEGWQFGSNVISSDYHTDKYFNGGVGDLTSAIRNGITDTFGTQEGIESMLVGALVGGGVSGARSVITRDSEGRGEYGQRKAAAKYATDVLNGGYFNNVEMTKANYDAQVKVAKDMDRAREQKDVKAFKDAQYKLLQYQAYMALETGTFDVFKQKLEDTKTLSDQEFAEVFGYNSEITVAEQTKDTAHPNGQSKEQVINNVLEKLDKFENVYNNINARFPSIPKTTGLPALLTSKEKLDAQDAVSNRRAWLREDLILSASMIENRNERLDGIQKKMQDLLTEASKINGIPMIEEDFNLHAILNQEDAADPKGGFNRIKQGEALIKAFKTITEKLQAKGAKADIAPFNKLATDYVQLFMDNAISIERYNNLASSKYFQDLFNQSVKENQQAAKQTAQDETIKENVANAETSKDVKDSVTDEASPEVKTEARQKIKALTAEENKARRDYLNLHKGKPFEEQLKMLQKLAQDNPDLTPTEKAGLAKAIEILENKIKRNEQADAINEEKKDDTSVEDLKAAFSVEDNVTRGENDEKIDNKKPEERVVTRTVKEDTKRKSIPTAEGQLNVVSAVNGAEIVEVQVEGQPTKYKIPVNEEGRVIEPEADTVTLTKPGLEPNGGLNSNIDRNETYIGENFEISLTQVDGKGQPGPKANIPKIVVSKKGADGVMKLQKSLTKTFKTVEEAKKYANKFIEKDVKADIGRDTIIRLKPQLLLADDIIGTEVEFEIIENDKWKSGEIRDLSSYPEDWMQIPIYYKIGDAYVGKLEASTNEDRKAIVDRLQKGQPVKTKISEILATNFNNAVDSTGAIAFSNPLEIFGDQTKNNDDTAKQDDIILGFTKVIPGEEKGDEITYQWTLSEVAPDKNRNNEVNTIKTQVQRTPTPRAYYQIGIVVKDENNPQGVARMSMASTANLNPKAQELVFNYIANQEYDKAKEIVASSNLEYDSRKGAELSSAYLEFETQPDGRQDIIYYSDALGSDVPGTPSGLIRLTADEMSKALNPNYEGPVSFALVTEKNNKFVGRKTDSVKTKIDIAADLKGFLQTKKYNVQREIANMNTPYTSPVTNIPYKTYQEYLFSSKELGEGVERIDGVGHNSILATDLVKKYQNTAEANTYSLFNSPRVMFEKGNILGETPAEIIKNTKMAENIPEIKEASIEQKRKEVLNKVRYLKGRDGFAEERSKPSYISFELDSEGKYKKWFSVETGSPTAKNKAAAKEKLIAQINEYYDAQLAETSPEAEENIEDYKNKYPILSSLAIPESSKTEIKGEDVVFKKDKSGRTIISSKAKKKTKKPTIKKSNDSQLNTFFDNLDKCD